MEKDGRTYLLPHPAIARVILTVAGAFILLVTPYELWRGLWPLNVTTPFFAVIMFGGMAIGASCLQAGLLAPSGTLRFSPGRIDVSRVYPRGRSRQIVRSQDIEGLSVEEVARSDGPHDWHAVIRLRTGPPIRSRPLATRQAAERLLAAFEEALRQDPE
jgi:hypothetical protein